VGQSPDERTLSMHELWTMAYRRRRLILLPFFFGWAAIWSLGWILPASYKSETVILVEHQKVPEQYVVPNVAVDLQSRLQTMTQEILSRTRLQHIIEQFNLYPKERARLGPDQLVDAMRKDVVIDLVQTQGDHSDVSAFKVTYSASSPRLAQQVTSELTSLFIDANLQARQQQSEGTTQFLETQLNEARKNLEQQEAKLREYKNQFMGELPEQLQSNVQILSGLQAQLLAANESLHQAEQQKTYLEALQSHYRSLKSTVGPEGSNPDSNEAELARLKAQLADYSSRYTPNHPDVVHLKEQIQKLESMQETAQAKNPKGDPDHPTTFGQLQAMTPMLQVESQLKANEVEIQNRQREVKELQSRVEGYQSRLNLTPLREQQLADVTRDHEQALKNYESLQSKELQSSLATNLEKRQEGERFTVIDPPTLPQKPYWPDRLRFGLYGLIVGLVLGISAAALTEIVQDRIRGEKELAEIFALPVLSGIPEIISPSEHIEQRRRMWLEAGAVAAMVLIICAGNFVSYYKG